jgi:transcriptional regulator with XRE-family HTH domain
MIDQSGRTDLWVYGSETRWIPAHPKPSVVQNPEITIPKEQILMASTPEPNFHGRQLTRALRVLREQAGMTQDEAGGRLNMSLQKVSRLENGQLPGYHELLAILDLYGFPTSEWDQYVELWRRAKERGWWRKYGITDCRYLRMEDAASHAYEFQIGYLPELLQTEHYARTTFADETLSNKTINGQVTARMTRQHRLTSRPQLHLHAIVHEPVLRQGVDREQLTHLIKQAQLPNVTFQVLPQAHGLHAGLRGSLSLLSFAGTHEPDIAFSAGALGCTDTQDNEETTAARRMLNRLAELALNPDETLELLAELKQRD